MIKKVKSRSEFSRNVLTLMTGSAVAQAIPIAISPILTRLYTPEDFGLLALFISLTAILSSIATGRYELAIMLPSDDEDAINIAALGVLIATSISSVLFLIVYIFNDSIVSLLGNEHISFWLYFVPCTVFFIGLYNVLNYLNTRKKLYRDIAKANVLKSVGLAAVQLLVGTVKAGALGLISGQIISHVIVSLKLSVKILSVYDVGKVKFLEMERLARRYCDFPKYSMWAILANTLAYNVTNILISLYYSVATLGFYSLSQRLLSMPTALIGKSIGQVYFQQAVAEKKETGRAIKTFKSTSKKLAVMSLLVFTPMFFVLPFVFEIVFGEEWRIAGVYAQLILPFVAMQFIASALSCTNSVFERQKISLIWQIGLTILSIGSLMVCYHLGIEFTDFLMIFSGTLFCYYLLLFYILWKVAKAEL